MKYIKEYGISFDKSISDTMSTYNSNIKKITGNYIVLIPSGEIINVTGALLDLFFFNQNVNMNFDKSLDTWTSPDSERKRILQMIDHHKQSNNNPKINKRFSPRNVHSSKDNILGNKRGGMFRGSQLGFK